jgi:predicted PurR-regulated permease PerM
VREFPGSSITVIGIRDEKATAVGRDQAQGYALSIIAVGVAIAILYWARIVFITTMAAVIIALILEPFVGLLVKIRFPRSFAAFVVCVFALLVIYFAGLTAFNQLSSIAEDAPALKEHISSVIENVSGRIQRIEESTARFLNPAPKPVTAPPPAAPGTTPAATKKNRRNIPQVPIMPMPPNIIPEVRIHEDRTPITDYVYASLGTLYQFILMASFVPLLVYFMLSWRDHIYKSFLRFFDGPARMTAARSVQGITGMARAFVVGNFMIGVFLAAISCALFAVIRLPYPFLIGVLSGFVSLVPYAGLVLALLPPVLAALAAGVPSPTILVALLVVAILHLVAMNILYPTLVGARVHLNPLIVTFSLMFWGFLWDAAGLVLAIPITAGLKAVCDNVAGLRKYGRFLGD